MCPAIWTRQPSPVEILDTEGAWEGVWAGGWGNARGELAAPRAEVSMGVVTPGALHHFPL